MLLTFAHQTNFTVSGYGTYQGQKGGGGNWPGTNLKLSQLTQLTKYV